MLSYFPCKVCRNSNTHETVVFYFNMGLCSNAILKAGSQPGVDIAGNVYSGCTDEVVPISESVSETDKVGMKKSFTRMLRYSRSAKRK